MKKVALIQSNYIPWKGYFDFINDVDEFYFYDEVQYTKNDWRNRNQIITKQGKQWLTITVRHEYLGQRIDEVEICNSKWAKKHWNTIKTVYGKCPNYKALAPFFEELYLDKLTTKKLSEINQLLVQEIAKLLKIETKIADSKSLNLQGDRNEKLVDLCLKTNSSVYVSGKAAQVYLDESLFQKNGISVEWYEYKVTPHKQYQIENVSCDMGVSIIDFLMNKQ